jgi:ATP-binding cassette subfamily C protein CydCD
MLGSAARAGRSVVWITHSTVGLDAMDRVLRLDVADEGGLSPGLVVSATAG